MIRTSTSLPSLHPANPSMTTLLACIYQLSQVSSAARPTLCKNLEPRSPSTNELFLVQKLRRSTDCKARKMWKDRSSESEYVSHTNACRSPSSLQWRGFLHWSSNIIEDLLFEFGYLHRQQPNCIPLGSACYSKVGRTGLTRLSTRCLSNKLWRSRGG